MASAATQESVIDIHSGGEDLRFPHHDNEIAQSEAYFGGDYSNTDKDCDCGHQWINYFLHTGHLHIEGQKMSKSLKNFITIEEALTKYTARQLRICFLLHAWDQGMDFSSGSINEAIMFETTLQNFFINVKALTEESKSDELAGNPWPSSHKVDINETNLTSVFNDYQKQIHRAFCDSINTPEIMQSLLSIVNKCNIYISGGRNHVNVDLLESIALYITRICRVFGLADHTHESIGFGRQNGEERSSMSVNAFSESQRNKYY